MNAIDRPSTISKGSPVIKGDLCDICLQKDDEDLYIIFNVLYRVIVDEIFFEASKTDELSYDLEVINNTEHKEIPKDALDEIRKNEDKIKNFKNATSEKMLTEIILSSHFDHILREIFKAKYSLLEHQICKHEALSNHIIKAFGLENDKNSDLKEKTLSNIERLDSLYNSVKQLKSDMDSSYNEINELCNHIVTKLFDSHMSNAKKELNDEEFKLENGELGENAENGSNENAQDSSEKTKSSSGNGNRTERSSSMKIRGASFLTSSGSNYSSANNGNGSHDTNGNSSNDSSNENGNGNLNSSHSNGNGNSEKSDEISNVNIQNKSKHLAFKSKLPKKSTDILKTWFLNHIQNPYPSHEAKEMLSKLTGLSKKQIQNWFTNSRKRFLEPLKKKIEKEDDQNEPNSGEDKPNIIIPEENPIPLRSQGENLQQKQPNPQINKSIQNNDPQSSRGGESSQAMPSQKVNKVIHQPQPIYTSQPLFYTAQQMSVHPGSNVVILSPYMMQGPMMYQYRPMNGPVQMNSNFVPLQQGNFVMSQPNFFGGSYMMPVQANYVDYRGMMPQNLSTNYNTINNNVYNNINNNGSIDTNISYNPELTPSRKSNGPEVWYAEENSGSEISSGKNGSIPHPKPDLEEAQYPINKHLHKDDETH